MDIQFCHSALMSAIARRTFLVFCWHVWMGLNLCHLVLVPAKTKKSLTASLLAPGPLHWLNDAKLLIKNGNLTKGSLHLVREIYASWTGIFFSLLLANSTFCKSRSKWVGLKAFAIKGSFMIDKHNYILCCFQANLYFVWNALWPTCLSGGILSY